VNNGNNIFCFQEKLSAQNWIVPKDVVRVFTERRGIGSDQALNVEGRVGGNETGNVEGGVYRMCGMISRRERATGRWPSALKAPDEVGGVEREYRPDVSGRIRGRGSAGSDG
jgi:hypothetical protein